MKGNYSITKIEPIKYTNEDWKAYFAIRLQCAKQMGASFLFPSWEDLKENNTGLINSGGGVYMMYHDNEAVGYFQFHLNFEDIPHKRYIHCTPRMVSGSFNPEFLRLIAAEFLSFDPQSKFLVFDSKDGNNDFIEDMLEIDTTCHRVLSKLKMEQAFVDVIDDWLDNIPRKYPHYRLQFYEDIPDNEIGTYADHFMEMMEDLPLNSVLNDVNITVEGVKEEQERGRKYNFCSYHCFLFNEDNRLIAQTNVLINKNDTKAGEQYMTGVSRDYRRQGLAKWLKAAMFKKLRNDFPEMKEIHTETHPKNTPSLGMSQQMGFREIGTEKDFLIAREEIERFIVKQ